MELKGTLNLLNGSRDKERGVFTLEFVDLSSKKTISIEISREEMAEIFFDNLYKNEPNCKITIPEDIGKQRIRETHWVKVKGYELKEDDVKKYFEEKGMNYDEWKRYEARTQSSTRYGKDGEPNEQAIIIIKYV